MIYFFIGLLAFSFLSIYMLNWGSHSDGDSGAHYVSMYFGIIGCIVSLGGLVFAAFLGLSWVGSGSKAGIINREYGTNYTQAEIFYASDVIDTVRELQRRRVEVNGDVFRDQADPNVQARREKAK